MNKSVEIRLIRLFSNPFLSGLYQFFMVSIIITVSTNQYSSLGLVASHHYWKWWVLYIYIHYLEKCLKKHNDAFTYNMISVPARTKQSVCRRRLLNSSITGTIVSMTFLLIWFKYSLFVFASYFVHMVRSHFPFHFQLLHFRLLKYPLIIYALMTSFLKNSPATWSQQIMSVTKSLQLQFFALIKYFA